MSEYYPIGVAHPPFGTPGASSIQSSSLQAEGSIAVSPGFRDGLIAVKRIEFPGGTTVSDGRRSIPAFSGIPGATTGWVMPEHVERLREAGTGAGHR